MVKILASDKFLVTPDMLDTIIKVSDAVDDAVLKKQLKEVITLIKENKAT